MDRFTGRLIIVLTALALAAAFATGAKAQVSKEDQGCVAEVNKNFGKIVKAQHKEVEGCVKNGSNEKLGGQSVDDCIVADTKGKVAGTQSKAAAGISKKCTPVVGSTLYEELFGSGNIYGNPTDAAQDEGVNKELRLVQMILGSDVDAATVLKSANKDAAGCQQALLKALFKCQDTKLKEYEKCKKTALKDGPASDEASLTDACLTQGGNPATGQPDPKGKIAKDCGAKYTDAIAKKCTAKGITDLATVAPGNCASSVSGDIAACLEIAVECDVCSSLNAVDGLNRDCDLFDDGLGNDSCGVCRNAIDQAAILSIGPAQAICILGCAGTPGCIASCGVVTTDADCTACLEATTVCSAIGPGAVCIPLCIADPTGPACQTCLRAAGCLDCFGITP